MQSIALVEVVEQAGIIQFMASSAVGEPLKKIHPYK